METHHGLLGSMESFFKSIPLLFRACPRYQNLTCLYRYPYVGSWNLPALRHRTPFANRPLHHFNPGPHKKATVVTMSANGPVIDDLADRQLSTSSFESTKPSSSRRSSGSGLVPPSSSVKLLFAQDVAVDRWLEAQLLFVCSIRSAATNVMLARDHFFSPQPC